MKSKINIIAEVGVNHNGSFDQAIKLIQSAKKCGADTVKFQTLFAEEFVKRNTKKVIYQSKTTSIRESHYDMIKKLELSEYDFFRIFIFCKKINIDFLSTPYDLKSFYILEKLKVKQYKVASTDLVDLILHKKIIQTKKPVIISTGASTLLEIKKTLDLYKKNKHKKITLLHCVSNYPCSKESLNLKIISKLKKNFGFPVGYSDHSNGSDAAKLAVALGATVIEKHLTLNNKLSGPDHKASANPKDFSSYIKEIRNAELLLGADIKKVQNEEKSIRKISRKSITLARDIKKGKKLKISDIIMKRPGTGLIGHYIDIVVGKKIKRDFNKDYQIQKKDLYK